MHFLIKETEGRDPSFFRHPSHGRAAPRVLNLKMEIQVSQFILSGAKNQTFNIAPTRLQDFIDSIRVRNRARTVLRYM